MCQVITGNMNKFQAQTLMFFATFLIFIGGYFLTIKTSDIDSSALCDFTAQNCSKVIAGQTFILTASPTPIKSESEIAFQLTAMNKSITITSAWIEGKNMYMGKIPLFFEENNTNYIATTLIGACTENSMVWTMFINLEMTGKPYLLAFDFTSYQ